MTVLTRAKSFFSISKHRTYAHHLPEECRFPCCQGNVPQQVPQAWPPVILPEDLGEGALSEVQLATAVFGQQHS